MKSDAVLFGAVGDPKYDNDPAAKTRPEQGYTELLYLNSQTREYIDEFGSSNFFAIKGNKYVIPLSDSVLPSITNKSLQQVARDLGMEVEKRRIQFGEIPDVHGWCQEI